MRPSTVARLVPRVLAVLLAASTPVRAQHPNHAQGFRPEHAYQLGGIENVDLFNGNLTLTIPLGQPYPVGPELSYGFTLTYTGNVWEWEEESDPESGEPYLQARPRTTATAGLGWDLSFGRYLGANAPSNPSSNPGYQSPDQATHELHYGKLHPNGEAFTDGTRFTQDGTYMRYKPGAGELDLPNGIKQYFGADGPTQIVDPFGNAVSIGYSNPDAQGDPRTWDISDTHARHHYVTFERRRGRLVVTQLALAKFGGGTALYTFHYTDTVAGPNDSPTLPRACNFPQSCFGTGGVCGDTSNVAVPLLTQVTLPDGSTYAMPYADYHSDSSSQCNARLVNGSLESLDLPTGGSFEWDWTVIGFPQESANVDGGVLHGNMPGNPFTLSAAVAERRWITRTGSELGHWDYERDFTSCPGETALCELAVTVTNAPPGDETKHYFSAYPGRPVGSGLSDPAGGWTKYEYGLAFTRRVSDGSSPGRYLSTEVFDKNGSKRRSSYVRFERSGASKANPRAVSTRTIYNDDGNRRADLDSSDFDGLGHYRRQITGGTLPNDNVRNSYTRFNPGKSISDVPNPGESWVLGTWDLQQVTRGSDTVTREAYFESANGFLKRTRARKNAGCGGSDVIFDRGRSSGFVSRETYYGGDGSSLSCSTALSNDAIVSGQPKRYEQRHTYQFGARATSTWYRPNGTALSFKELDRTIDRSTGLPSSSRDTASLQTSFSYDDLGRVTSADLPSGEGADTTWTYGTESGSSPALVTVKSKNGSTVLTEEQARFDGFGRVEEERRRMPDGTWSVRQTDWSSRGWIDQRSEWFTLGGTAHKTLYRQYDPFGRVGTLKLPDGYPIDIDYSGVRTRSVSVPVATSRVSGNPVTTDATTVEVYDRFGELVRVTEPNGTRTSYTYDTGGDLVTVRQNDLGSPIQTRTFAYDDRGFLTSESHPELGSSVSYSEYDALGNPGRIQRGGWDLSYAYDEAARLTEIRESGTSRIWKSWSYATGNNQAGLWSKGKLTSTTRLNRVPYPPAPSVIIEPVVTESYRYDGVGGRISKVTTDVAVGGYPHFEYDLTYDPLGDVISRSYPKCTHLYCSQASVNRTISNGFTRGFLTSVPSYASQITYNPNGSWSTIEHTNGVDDVQVDDPYDMLRPMSVSTTGASVNYSSGTYGYDGAGNITKMGAERFTYDALSRIVDADLYLDQAGSPAAAQSYTYDMFGNLLTMTTQLPGQGTQTRTIGTSSSTNRMTSAGYDTSGNVTSWAGQSYDHDPFDMITQTNGFTFVYGPGDERIWTIDWSAGADVSNWIETWTLRDLGGSPLRELRSVGGNDSGHWTLYRDYVWGVNGLLAAITPQGTRHFHLDHLGSPRLVTNTTGTTLERHEYFPFGEEATLLTQDGFRLKFTGHERDDLGASGTTEDLDYMHRRFFSPHLGRFLSTDPLAGHSLAPQAFNLYGYTLGNPVKYTDPRGMWPFFPLGDIPYFDTITVIDQFIPLAPYNPLTGVQGLGDLLSGRSFLNSLSGPAPRGSRSSRGPMRSLMRQVFCPPIAQGISGDISTINPFTSGGGGSYGLNLQYVPGEGLALYGFATPNDIASVGFDVGGSLTINGAIGSGPWTGDFITAMGTVGSATFGGFGTPSGQATDGGIGFHGIQGGITGGVPFGLGATTTRFSKLADLSFLIPWCQ